MNFTGAIVPASPTSPTVPEKKFPHTQKDTTWTKIFVGGLPFHTTGESLRKFFEPFGEIEEAVVITDRNHGRSKGYGFVTMTTKEGAKDATSDPNPIIDGRKANVNLAFLGAKPRNNPTSDGFFDLRFLAPAARQTPTQALLQTPYGIPPPSQVYQSAVAPGYVMLQPTAATLPYHPSLPNQTFYDLSAAYQQQLNANVAYEQYGFASPGYISPTTLAYAVPQAGSLPASAATYTQYQSTPQVAGERMQ